MSFIKNPHLPFKEATLFLIDRNAENITINNLIKSYSHSNLLRGINTHPDMTFCPLKDNDIVVAKESYDYYSNLLLPYGFNVIEGENELRSDYPFDIAYNCVILNNKLFHRIQYTDKKIIKYCEEKEIELVDVKQGYTKCSTLIVDEKSVITCDKKLNEIYIKNGIDSLYVDNKNILINNFDHGFIGGCGGKISKDKIAFFGDIKKHKDFDKIHNFLKERKITYTSITKGPLFDYGSLIPLLT